MSEKMTLEEYQAEFDRLWKWRDLWTRLANRDSAVYPQKGNSGARRSKNAVFLATLQKRDDAVQRRAKIADNKIGDLMRKLDSQRAAEKLTTETNNAQVIGRAQGCGRCAELATATQNFIAVQNDFINLKMQREMDFAKFRRQREGLEKENKSLKYSLKYLEEQLRHVNSLPSMDFAKITAELMQTAASIVKRETKAAAKIKANVDFLHTFFSQKEKERIELQAKIDELENKIFEMEESYEESEVEESSRIALEATGKMLVRYEKENESLKAGLEKMHRRAQKAEGQVLKSENKELQELRIFKKVILDEDKNTRAEIADLSGDELIRKLAFRMSSQNSRAISFIIQERDSLKEQLESEKRKAIGYRIRRNGLF